MKRIALLSLFLSFTAVAEFPGHKLEAVDSNFFDNRHRAVSEEGQAVDGRKHRDFEASDDEREEGAVVRVRDLRRNRS